MSYYEEYAISNSSLSLLNPEQGGHPKKFKKFLDGEFNIEKTEALHLGELFHYYCLEPDKFEVSDVTRPNTVISKSIEDAVEYYQNFPEKLNKETIHQFVIKNIQNNWKESTIKTKLEEKQHEEYINYLLNPNKKNILSRENYEILENLKKSYDNNQLIQNLISFKTTDDFFIYEKQVENEKEIFFDYNLEKNGEINSFKCKAKVDKIIWKDNFPTLIDIKTTGKPLSLFGKTIDQFRYYRQAAFYLLAVSISKQLENIPKDFYFVVIEKQEPYSSGIFKLSEEKIQQGLDEINELFEQIDFYYKNGWDYTIEEKTNGYILI